MYIHCIDIYIYILNIEHTKQLDHQIAVVAGQQEP